MAAAAEQQLDDPEVRREAMKRLFDEGKFLARYPADLIDSRPCRKWGQSSTCFGSQVKTWQCLDKEPLSYIFPTFEEVNSRGILSTEFRPCAGAFWKMKKRAHGEEGEQPEYGEDVENGASVRQQPKRSADDALEASSDAPDSWADDREADEADDMFWTDEEQAEEELAGQENRADSTEEHDMGVISDSSDDPPKQAGHDLGDDEMGVISDSSDEDVGIVELGDSGGSPRQPLQLSRRAAPVAVAVVPAASTTASPSSRQKKPNLQAFHGTHVAWVSSPVSVDVGGELQTPAGRLRAMLTAKARAGRPLAACEALTPQKPMFAISAEAVREAPADLRRMAKEGLIDVVSA